MLWTFGKEYLFVISARASAIPCFPPVLAPIPLFLPPEDLPFRLFPSTFPLRVRYRLPNCVDLFNFVVDLGRKNLPVPSGGGGGGAAPFPHGIGGGGAGNDPPFKGMGDGGGGAAAAEPEPGSNGGGVGGGGSPTATAFCCNLGADDGGGGGGGGGGATATFGCSTGGVGGGGGSGTVSGSIMDSVGGVGGGGIGVFGGGGADEGNCCSRVGVCAGLGDGGCRGLGDGSSPISAITSDLVTSPCSPLFLSNSSVVSKSKARSSEKSFSALLDLPSTSISLVDSSSILHGSGI